ncbi:probable methyltransferase-like protein 24 isoform X2 [Haliotis rufescens]|uniref:probable methyltransferase-like protein 24 isoform X1 n=1 Tax=Haliotis rufescens TaxID=6454 RepID=UPI00201F731B|nr:probable methyltransferase-like protein 24 isoform X1 [Haliotis rufescens]XP_048238462.1 probable methyltransferase-like protein 24 isoform X2 [Haliotis rufescens]
MKVPWNRLRMKIARSAPMVSALIVSAVLLYIASRTRPRQPMFLDQQDRVGLKSNAQDGTKEKKSLPEPALGTGEGVAAHPIPLEDKLRTMTNKQLATLYNDYLTNVQVLCRDKIRMGNIHGGGWDVCVDGHYKLKKDNCIVYSFGIDNDFSFDDDVADTFGCEVHAFDPSMNKDDHLRGKLINFHNLGLADINGNGKRSWPMKTLPVIRQDNGHAEKEIDYVKIDIEDSEWGALRYAFKTDALKGIKQLSLEFHMFGKEEVSRYIARLNVLRELYNQGYRIFWTTNNVVSACRFTSVFDGRQRTKCHEVYFLKWV